MLPIAIPAETAAGISGLIQQLQRQTREHFRRRTTHALYTAYDLFGRLPTTYAAALLARSMRPGTRSGAGLGLAPTPSLRLDYVGPLPDRLTEFCGAPVLNEYGYSGPLPRPGFGLHTNLTHERLNISVVGFEGRIPRARLAGLLDRLIARLLGQF